MAPSREHSPDRLVATLVAAFGQAGPDGGGGAALEALKCATGATWIGLEPVKDRDPSNEAPESGNWLVDVGTRSPGAPAFRKRLPLTGGVSVSLTLEFAPGADPPADLDVILAAVEPIFGLAMANRFLTDRLARQQLLVRSTEEMLRRVANGEGEEELLGSLCALLIDAFPVDRVAIYSLTDDDQWIVRRAVIDRRPDLPESTGSPIPFQDFPAIRECQGGHDLVELTELTDLELPMAWREAARQLGIRAALLAPIIHGDRLWGIVALSCEAPGHVLRPEEASLLRRVIRQTAPILHNVRMMRSLSRGLAGLEVLLETSREVSSVLDLSEVPRVVARRAMSLTEAEEGVVFLLDGPGGRLKPVLALSPFEAEIMKLEIQVGEGVTGQVASRRIGEYVNRVDLDPRSKYIPGTPTVPEALLAAPLICADRLIGVMTLYKLDGRTFNDVDLATINIFATQAAIAIENARLFERMEEERARLAIMLEQMEEAVFLCGPDGVVGLINPAAERLFAGRPTAGGRPMVDAFPEDLREDLAGILAGLGTPEGRHQTREFRMDGRIHLASFTAIRDAQGHLIGLMSLWKDITDFKTIESRLMMSSKMSAVGQLASGVAHEFNNLIAAIYGYAQFMKDNRDEKLFEKGIRIILSSSERARDLTRSLLTFSRATDGRVEALDPNELMDDVLILVEQQLIKEGICVERHYGRLPHAIAERGRLQEVFLNLISNARHAMPEGGILSLASRMEGQEVIIEVTDSGIGIPPEHLPRIFEPFFTTKGPLNATRVPGTGLGLFTVYNTVQAHGGRTEVESSPGTGTIVRLIFPAGLKAAA
ncbi:MAG: ATP-binding protein [Candidatus Eisenbacteria bacterium]|nr:ATP-binding protein [Candidatus Eisenbacteria bacterium]